MTVVTAGSLNVVVYPVRWFEWETTFGSRRFNINREIKVADILYQLWVKFRFSRKRNVHIGEGRTSTPTVVRRKLRDDGQRCNFVNVSDKLTIKARMLATLATVIILFGINKFRVKNRLFERYFVPKIQGTCFDQLNYRCDTGCCSPSLTIVLNIAPLFEFLTVTAFHKVRMKTAVSEASCPLQAAARPD